MAKPALSDRLAMKALSAARSAIEIFNKPVFDYKQESFVILITNSWELLIKAKILKDSGHKKNSIYVQSKPQTKNGAQPKRFYPAKNRCGNPKTIDIFAGLRFTNIDQTLKSQIELLVELRDNAIHFINDEKQLTIKIFQIATATVRSFIKCYKTWFPEIDLVEPILPIGFQVIDSIPIDISGAESGEVKRILDYVHKVELRDTNHGEHAISYNIDISLSRNSRSADVFRIDNENTAAFPIRVQEADLIDSNFGMDYEQLRKRLKTRRPDLRYDKRFVKIYNEVKNDPRLCLIRHLDPRNSRSTKKAFFSQQAVDYILSRI